MIAGQRLFSLKTAGDMVKSIKWVNGVANENREQLFLPFPKQDLENIRWVWEEVFQKKRMWIIES